jgi:Pyridoxamine 5'-phosphate oxidase
MLETSGELDELDALLAASMRAATEHLRNIMDQPTRSLTGREVAKLLTGMKTLALATVSRSGEPRISGVDGHFLHGRWVFTTSGRAAKARQLRQRPAASAAHINGDDLGVYAHGRVEFLDPANPDFAGIEEHLTAHYGSSPSSWGDDIAYLRLQPHWMVGYAFDKAKLLG